MDGSNESRKVIVNDDIFWPNGLSVDYINEVIYWEDGKLKFIAMVDYDGRNRRKILTTGMEYPYGLTFFQNKIYWSDWKTWSIYELDRNSTNSTPKTIINSEYVPTDVRAYESQRQPPMITPCSNNNGGCSHLCLLSTSPPGYKCACPTGVKLVNQFSCANGSQEILIVVQRNGINKISLDCPDYTTFKLPLQGIRYTRLLFWTCATSDVINITRIDGNAFKVDSILRNISHKPRNLALHPERGFLFWTDLASNHKIFRSRLDGSEKLIIASELKDLTAITVDRVSNYLFFAHSYQIDMCDLEGQRM